MDKENMQMTAFTQQLKIIFCLHWVPVTLIEGTQSKMLAITQTCHRQVNLKKITIIFEMNYKSLQGLKE